MKVIPAPGRAVRDPRSMMLLPDEGRDVPEDDPFWNRRIRDGDVTVVEPPEQQRGATQAKAAPPAAPAQPNAKREA